MRGVILTIAALTLAACSAGADVSEVNAAAHRFHDLQIAGSDETIYAEADQGFRDGAPIDLLQRFNSAVRNAKCETPLPADATTWNITTNTSGLFTTLTYQHDCQRSPLIETFVFKKTDDVWRLYNYNANGMALLPAAPSTAPPPPAPVAAAAAEAPANAAKP